MYLVQMPCSLTQVSSVACGLLWLAKNNQNHTLKTVFEWELIAAVFLREYLAVYSCSELVGEQ